MQAREKSRIVVEIDQTCADTDRRLDGDLEVKYSADATGIELRLCRDSIAPAPTSSFATASPSPGHAEIGRSMYWVLASVTFRNVAARLLNQPGL